MRSKNFYLAVVEALAPYTANTEFSVTHDLGTIPSEGFVLRRGFDGASLYKSGTAWTKTTAYFKSDTSSARVVIGLMA